LDQADYYITNISSNTNASIKSNQNNNSKKGELKRDRSDDDRLKMTMDDDEMLRHDTKSKKAKQIDSDIFEGTTEVVVVIIIVIIIVLVVCLFVCLFFPPNSDVLQEVILLIN
jgi:hypothetical protein